MAMRRVSLSSPSVSVDETETRNPRRVRGENADRRGHSRQGRAEERGRRHDHADRSRRHGGEQRNRSRALTRPFLRSRQRGRRRSPERPPVGEEHRSLRHGEEAGHGRSMGSMRPRTPERKVDSQSAVTIRPRTPERRSASAVPSRCEICGAPCSPWQASRDQHRRFNEYCIACQLWNELGPEQQAIDSREHWDKCLRDAKVIKQRRMAGVQDEDVVLDTAEKESKRSKPAKKTKSKKPSCPSPSPQPPKKPKRKPPTSSSGSPEPQKASKRSVGDHRHIKIIVH